MSARPDVAILRTMAQIAEDKDALVGQKVRTYGRILAYDRAHGLLMLWSGKHALFVDATLCASDHSASWLDERAATVFVIGYVERMESPPRTFARPAHLPPGEVRAVEGVRIQAIVVKAELHVDVGEWEATVGRMAARGALAGPR